MNAGRIGAGVVSRVGEDAVLASGAAVDVEDRIAAAVLDVHPDRPDRAEAGGLRGAVRDEVDRVADRKRHRLWRQVVDHVVDRPDVARLVAVAESARHLHDRLLLAGAHEQPRAAGEIGEDAVVEHHLVGFRGLALPRPRRPDEVGPHADDPAIHPRALAPHDRPVGDPVLAGGHVQGPDRVGDPLDTIAEALRRPVRGLGRGGGDQQHARQRRPNRHPTCPGHRYLTTRKAPRISGWIRQKYV